MIWKVQLGRRAERTLKRAPNRDRDRMIEALKEMSRQPFSGDLRRLRGQPNAFRRRVGSWRIFFDVDLESQVIRVVGIKRRTSTTY